MKKEPKDHSLFGHEFVNGAYEKPMEGLADDITIQ